MNCVSSNSAGWPLIIVGGFLLATFTSHAADPVSFSRDIRPVMSDTCFKCHGPDDKTRKGKLRLDVREEALKAGKSGKVALIPGKPEKSEIIARLFTANTDDVMPPADSHKTISAAQKELFRRWVAEGAKYSGHWAFEPPALPAVPKTGGQPIAIHNPIDAFLAGKLDAERLRFQPEASREVLLRRVTLALTGLPPTLAEVDALLADPSPRA